MVRFTSVTWFRISLTAEDRWVWTSNDQMVWDSGSCVDTLS